MLRLMLVSSLILSTACTTNEPANTESSGSGTEPAPATGESSATTGPGATETGSSGDTSGEPGTSASSTTGPGPDPTTGGPPDPTTGGASDPTTGATDETGTAAVSFTDVFEQVILPNGCNSGYCHGDGFGGLELTDEATSYANLVEVQASAPLCGQSVLVVPGAPDESVLWYRVRPTALDAGDTCAEASKMPKGSMGVSDSQAELVEKWIAGGALE